MGDTANFSEFSVRSAISDLLYIFRSWISLQSITIMNGLLYHFDDDLLQRQREEERTVAFDNKRKPYEA
jgi:hypothetical protein